MTLAQVIIKINYFFIKYFTAPWKAKLKDIDLSSDMAVG